MLEEGRGALSKTIARAGTLSQRVTFWGRCEAAAGQAMEAKLRQGYSASAAGFVNQHGSWRHHQLVCNVTGWHLRVRLSSCIL
jgi:hypothetical protein